ncbi:MAG: 5-(carboxyamino)imidazole ribonucleotide synthase [Vitreoscilla sp.]
MTLRRPLPPGATLGVLGGGQLGRMFVHAAQTLGFDTLVLDPDKHSPAGVAAHYQLCAPYDDPRALAEMAGRCDAVTTEFENVPAPSLASLAQDIPVAPAAAAVAICQDRATEKAHFERAGVPCAPYAVIETTEQLAAVPDDLLPGILKTSRLGYDGKGQVVVADRAALAAAWAQLRQVSCVLEKRLPLKYELSIIVARGADGALVNLPVQQNLHRSGILALTTVPAPDVTQSQSDQAIARATAIAESMDYVGVLCIEFFVLEDGGLVANEMAPRPHNSGHYSIDACDLSQFELQVRTLAGLPLVTPRQHSPCEMVNLLGDLWFDNGHEREPDWKALLALPGMHLHLYGKTQARPGRKMGHLTVTAATPALARERANAAAAVLGLQGF